MRVLIAEHDQQLARERAEQLLIDGHLGSIALTPTVFRLKLSEQADAVLLGSLGSVSLTIAQLRDLRAGTIPGADSTTPVLVVGADHDDHRIRYYRAGADALLPTGSSPLLVAAALEALEQRARHRAPRLLKVATLVVDCDARTAHIENRALTLTRLEFDLLQTLAAHPGKAFTRAELTRDVWGYDPAAVARSCTIDSTAHRLRKKLEQAGAPKMMHSIRGVGWRLAR